MDTLHKPRTSWRKSGTAHDRRVYMVIVMPVLGSLTALSVRLTFVRCSGHRNSLLTRITVDHRGTKPRSN